MPTFIYLFQVKLRADECIQALNKLIEINSGAAVQNALKTQFDWTTLEVTVKGASMRAMSL